VTARNGQELPRIIAAAEASATDPFPHGREKLFGAEHTYRIRIRDYRLVYEVMTAREIVEVQRVRHRKNVYRQ
jgi:mRNA interferase RelE/StbE